MFSRKKSEPQKKRNHDTSQYGLFEIPDDFDPSGGGLDDDEVDSDLEAELAAITGGGQKPKPKPKPKKIIPDADLDRMVSESLRDISDDDISDDEDDPTLLGELQDITGEPIEQLQPADTAEEPPQVFLPTTTSTANINEILKTRIKMYAAAEANAKAANETSRARRFNRGLKTLQDMLKQSNTGKSINVDDIPPEVIVKGAQSGDVGEPEPVASPPIPARRAPSIPTSEQSESPPSTPASKTPPEELQKDSPKINMLKARQHEYKVAALNAKRSGDKPSAIQFVQIIKQFDAVIKAAEEGNEIDLSDMPPHPNELKDFMAKMQAAQGEGEAESETTAPPPEQVVPEEPPSTPKTILEGLQQRLDKYKFVEAAAKAEGNSGKARRFGRIIKQYEEAIKAHKEGRAVVYDELPIPPGFGPLPTEGSSSASAPAKSEPAASIPALPVPSPPPRAAPKAVPESPTGSTGSSKTSPRKHESSTRVSGNHVGTTLVEKQMNILLERQKEFKLSAIEAKKAGEIEQAKEYLKIYKGFESLLNATSMGLPVDLDSLPIPPSQRANLEDSFAFVNDEECDDKDDIADISVRLEEQLAKQLMMCRNTRDHHKAMGDVAGMNRFENLALTVQKDLDLVRFSRRKKLAIPKFHYEQKSFNIVHCNTDLTDNEVEITVVRGIQYNVPNPKDVDTYVKIEFPYPQDDTFKAKSNLVRNTDSPDYDQKYKVEIQRPSRQCQRIFKRQAAKFEIYSRGGFLRSDILIGTVNVKLQPLETKCEIHDSFNLMDGRKMVGGKLEVKIRIRNPIVAKQIEHVNEKWLILDA